MHKKYLILLVSAFVWLAAPPLFAQQSSKSKSRDRFREKNILRQPMIRNATSLNGPGSDYCPAYYPPGIVYASTSSRVGPAGRNYIDKTAYDIYYAPLDPNNEPTARTSFSEEINSTLNEGQVAISRGGRVIFFNRNNMHKGVQKADASGKVVRMKIYSARLGRYDWENVQELPFNSDEYSCVHPNLSIDSSQLFFASDMPGGYGGYDLYVSRFENGNWSTPQNLGPEINTDKNEVFPFMTAGGKTLFFTSGGHNSLGGLDLFYVNLDKIDEGVVNLNEPFNSPEDDLGIILNADGTRGFFASNRPGGRGKDDIYSFFVENGIEGVEKPPANHVQILVIDGRTQQAIPQAAIRILHPSDDGFMSAQNDFYDIDLTPTPESPNSLSLRLIRKDADKLGAPDNYTNAAGYAYADFVMYRSYLILASFDGYQTAERLYSVEPDKGGTVTLALFEEAVCHRTTGVVVTDKIKTRLPNALLTFTHKESNQEVSTHTDAEGDFELCLPLEGEYLLQVKREGFRPHTLSFTAVRNKSINHTIRLQPVDVNAPDAEKAEALLARPIQDGYVITMDKIRFEPGRATLNQSAVRHLDALLELMQRYPEMEIDLAVHTDSRGDAKANLALSEERAKNAKTYLVYKGIAENRIAAFGKGESQLRNRCADGVQCSDAEHQLNNRIEIKVRKVGKTP